MKNPHDVIKGLLRTEKGAFIQQKNKYLFWVSKDANKIEIRNAVAAIYKVKVLGVNTMVLPGKNKRVRYVVGKTPDWKKAIVTLKEGDKIDVA